jgi:DNA-binding NarL/FixJ family response regulator
MRIRVVIVDDHALVREGLVHLLTSYSEIEVVGTAEDGLAALELVRNLTPEVLLLDIAMPRLDGVAALPRLLRASPNTRVLVLSMYDEPEYAQAVLDLGACGLVSKAASADVLRKAIHAAAHGKTLPINARLLSRREKQVLALIVEGKSNEEIASALSIRSKTVEHHAQRMMNKLDIHTRAGLVVYAKRIGLA